MSQIETSDLRGGMKVEIEGQPYVVVANQFVKPGKGQAFSRTKLKHLTSGRVIEKTYKSGEKIDEADVLETKMRYIYTDGSDAVFMDDNSYEQTSVPLANIDNVVSWLMEDVIYDVVFYNGEPVTVEPPTFMELKITETEPGAKGDTASGRVLKPAVTETGAKVQIPIFINEGEVVKIDTRTGEYVSRAGK